jgi:erythronate-4-phosphate dehydrogenase
VAQYIASTLLSLAMNEAFHLKGKTLGVIGVGNVGTKVARVGRALGMNVLLNDPPRKRNENSDEFVDLDMIIENSDVITCHVPLNRGEDDNTFHLVDDDFLQKMKSTAFLINSSRGEVVDNQALKTALKNKTIAGAVLDVWENEPAIDLELLKLLNYATPHIAGYSADGKANGTMMSVQAVSRFFKLGLDDWTPKEVPVPDNTIIDCSDGNYSDEQILYKAVTETYDIQQDSLLLMSSPETFEKQRGEYPLRREPGVYTVINAPEHLRHTLEELLFIVN